MRILHFSDIHVGVGLGEVPIRRWFGKRALSAVNLLRGRGRRFAQARPKLEALARFSLELPVDLVIFSGDYTAMGLDPEFEAARAAVRPLMGAPLGFVNVPGNHDLYVPEVIRAGRFERFFGDTLEGDLPEYRADGPWPLVRLVDNHLAVIALNSSRPNPLPWRSSGRIPPAQLAAFGKLLGDPRLRERFLLVVTHYAPRMPNGERDRLVHRMVNDNEFLAASAEISRGAILCGHVHRRYCVRVPGVQPPVFCAGSATMSEREGFWLFEIDGCSARAVPGRWNGSGYELDRNGSAEIGP